MPAKLLGVALIVAGLLIHRGIKRARERGFTGSGRRRIHRAERPLQFRFALGTQMLGALICFISAFLCLTGILSHPI